MFEAISSTIKVSDTWSHCISERPFKNVPSDVLATIPDVNDFCMLENRIVEPLDHPSE